MHDGASISSEGAAVSVRGSRGGRKSNVRLALVLALVAVAFYLGILLLKHP